MKSGKFWLAVLAGGVVGNILDYLVQGMWLSQSYYMQMPDTFSQTPNIAWYVIGDFVAVFVFAWVFNKVSASFGSTPKDGAMAGLYLGIFANFPLWIFMHLMLKNYPYSLSWISTIYGIIWYMIVGYIIATVMKRGTAAAAA